MTIIVWDQKSLMADSTTFYPSGKPARGMRKIFEYKQNGKPVAALAVCGSVLACATVGRLFEAGHTVIPDRIYDDIKPSVDSDGFGAIMVVLPTKQTFIPWLNIVSTPTAFGIEGLIRDYTSSFFELHGEYSTHGAEDLEGQARVLFDDGADSRCVMSRLFWSRAIHSPLAWAFEVENDGGRNFELKKIKLDEIKCQ